MTAAYITHPTYGTWGFASMLTPTGWPIDQANAVEEELTSPGVDGKRWRTSSVQETEIQITSLSDFTSYDLAIVAARTYLKMKSGDPVLILVTIRGVNYRFRNVHILDVMPRAVPGTVVGADATANSVAHVVTEWRAVLMDTTVTGENG